MVINMKYKYLILGAGPAGLTFANLLKEHREESFLILEKETEAGGLCRSAEVDGAPLDIGGGHFLDVRRPEVNRFLFRFMPEEEWNLYVRDSRISINGGEVSHPIEANIWQMDIEDQVRYLKSIATAGCNQDTPMPEDFLEAGRTDCGGLYAALQPEDVQSGIGYTWHILAGKAAGCVI